MYLIRKHFFYLSSVILLTLLLFSSCLNKNAAHNASSVVSLAEQIEINEILPPSKFELDLEYILSNYDPYLWILVDKKNALSSSYEPDDLFSLDGREVSYRIGRNDMFLREPAFYALEEMAQAAREDGLTLLASSAYRSYEYQEIVYSSWVRQYGREEADRFSARPGHSQHQLGLVVDFGSITDEFAETAEGKWLYKNASKYGWSLSYPQGYEHITGYKWESWHYRYVGKELAAFIDEYFDGIQQYALEYLHELR